jgi:hypothetical protein
MPMYHAEPNRSEPASYCWYSVSTPSVFREYKLPVCDSRATRSEKRKFAELHDLAEQHGTRVHASPYRRG